MIRRREFLAAVNAAAPLARAQPAGAKGPRQARLMRVNFGAGSTLTFDDMCRGRPASATTAFDWSGRRTGHAEEAARLHHGAAMGRRFATLIRIEAVRRHRQIDARRDDLCASNGWPNIITVGGERRASATRKESATALNASAHAKDGGDDCIESEQKYRRQLRRADLLSPRLGVTCAVNSPRVKLLFHIYHAQIRRRRLRQHREYFPPIAFPHRRHRAANDDTQGSTIASSRRPSRTRLHRLCHARAGRRPGAIDREPASDPRDHGCLATKSDALRILQFSEAEMEGR